MTETTDKALNNSVSNKNKNIIRARLPGPLQFRENFENRGRSESTSAVESFKFCFFLVIFLSFLIIDFKSGSFSSNKYIILILVNIVLKMMKK